MVVFFLSLFLSASTALAQSLADLNDDYPTLRRKFQIQAVPIKEMIPGVQLRSDQVPSSFDQKLFIDSIYIPAAGTMKKLVVLTSGVHGVEASAGSYQQRLFMSGIISNKLGTIDRSHTATLIVHIVNPYGFKYGRRANENNVDLNRNCFDYRRIPFPGPRMDNRDYDKNRTLFENPTNAFRFGARAIFNSQGIRASLSGQFTSPEGIYYGGANLQSECRIVQRLIERYAEKADAIVHFDFHTGLGQKGLSQIMLNAPSLTMADAYYRELRELRQLFPQDLCNGTCEVQEITDSNFATVGDFTQWLHERFPNKRKSGLIISVTNEIGTYHPLTVMPAIINENYCFWHPEKCDPAKMAIRTQKLRSVFNPNEEVWRRQLEKSATQTCNALLRFSEI